MALQKEKERRFALAELPPLCDVTEVLHIVQGYTNVYSKVTQRVRITTRGEERTGHFTLKATPKKDPHLGSDEVEVEIPLYMAEKMLKQDCGTAIVHKNRLVLKYGHGDVNLKWEVDIFRKKLKGLHIVEIELTDPFQKIITPYWVGREITHQKGTSNKKLAIFQSIPEGLKKQKYDFGNLF